MSKIIASSDQPLFSGWRKLIPTISPHRVRMVEGVFQNWRRVITWPLLLACFVTPWLTWDGQALVHFDLVDKQFRFGSFILWPEDLILLTWAMMAGAFGLFTVSMIAGRLWCGYSCPQTVWTFLFLRLEELIEGSRHKRLKLDRSGWSTEKVVRRTIKHLAWLVLSLFTGLTFVAYFYPLSSIATDWSAGLPLMAWFWILFFAVFTYMNAGFLREKVCTHMCPYSRFQSVMSDDSTKVVHYDTERKDCIDCEVCVQVCPTGIDIRDGLQLECIACGACVDACDDIMTKINKPKELISYRPSERSNEKITSPLNRPRLLGYAALFFISLSLGINEVSQREDINSSLIRDRQQLYRVNANDEFENYFTLKLHNKTTEGLNVTLRLRDMGIPLAQAKIQLSQSQFKIPALTRQQFSLTISASQNSLIGRDRELVFEVIDQESGAVLTHIQSSFLAPQNLAAL